MFMEQKQNRKSPLIYEKICINDINDIDTSHSAQQIDNSTKNVWNPNVQISDSAKIWAQASSDFSALGFQTFGIFGIHTKLSDFSLKRKKNQTRLSFGD